MAVCMLLMLVLVHARMRCELVAVIVGLGAGLVLVSCGGRLIMIEELVGRRMISDLGGRLDGRGGRVARAGVGHQIIGCVIIELHLVGALDLIIQIGLRRRRGNARARSLNGVGWW